MVSSEDLTELLELLDLDELLEEDELLDEDETTGTGSDSASQPP